MKKFLYLIQGKKELPEHLNGLHDSENDVIFLSWKKPTKKGIFFPNSTWTEGRNRLYQEVIHLKKDYLYYVFMDEDARLATTKYCKVPCKNPWRLFEQYLLEYQPAVGVPFYCWHRKPEMKVDTTFTFDAIVKAIHQEALNVLLPYYDGDDKESWWYSQLYFVHMASLLYPSHTLQFNTLEAINSSHQDGDAYSDIIQYPHAGNWDKINNLFKSSIIDNKLKERFYPHPQSVSRSNGEVKRKDKSYHYSKERLSGLFNLETPFWKRKFEIKKNI